MFRRAAHLEELGKLLEETDDETLDQLLESTGSVAELLVALRLTRRTGHAPGESAIRPHMTS
jgi:hypothetical protein